MVSARFGISRQAANNHLKKLVAEKALVRSGKTRSVSYFLHPMEAWENDYDLSNGLAEDVVWREDVARRVGAIPENVLSIWHYGFTEMFNNAIDHSDGNYIYLRLEKTAASTEIMIQDDGIGIFRKIQSELGLLDERHANLELSKGKLTTDPENHTGEGIFFASRMFDNFAILSGGIYFSHDFGKKEDWILERERGKPGTAVFMKLNNHASRTTSQVFGRYTSGDDLGFTKTVVPVRLVQYGQDHLVSRSQAKRLLARVDRFKMVILDFMDVDMIGQAFADEIFRVFQNRHPEIELVPTNTNGDVGLMISRVRSRNS